MIPATEPEWYYEISLPVESQDVDAVSNYIIENLSSGILLEEEDGTTSTVVRFYLGEEGELPGKLDGLMRYLAAIDDQYRDVTLKSKKITNLDWIDAYQKSVEPVLVGDSIVILAPWHDRAYPKRTEILLEPKMAFGTGRHESTRGCLMAMEALELSDKRVLDLGCGSGILGIYAALRGAALIDGYDIDPLAVDNSRENYRVNSVQAACTAHLGGIHTVAVEEKYDLVIVNIIKSVILPILPLIQSRTDSGGRIILSGLLVADREEIADALASYGMADYSILSDNEWITFTVRLP